MRRTSLASLLALVLALTGGFAAPSRTAQTSQIVTAIAWYHATPEKPPSRPHTTLAQYSGRVHGTIPFPVPQSPEFSTPRLTHSLYQRPPPDRS